jgi:hypothetical protein
MLAPQLPHFNRPVRRVGEFSILGCMFAGARLSQRICTCSKVFLSIIGVTIQRKKIEKTKKRLDKGFCQIFDFLFAPRGLSCKSKQET